MKVGVTNRGFERIDFDDLYGTECSLQVSSLAIDEAVWLGCNDPDPRVCVPGEGWKGIPLPPETVCNTRMHLNRRQLKKLLPHLKRFVEEGRL